MHTNLNRDLILNLEKSVLKLKEAEQALDAEIKIRQTLEKALEASEERFKTLEGTLATRLKQARKLEAIGTLAGGIAHDFNNILAVISGNCELATLVSKPDSATRPFLAAIAAASDRARNLVEQILNFSRNTDQDKRPILVYVVLNEALKLLRASLPATIEFNIKLCRDMHYVMADVTQIYEVIVSLCTYAAQSMTDSGGTLSVSLTPLHFDTEAARFAGLTSGPYLKLEISGTGEGTEPDHLKRSSGSDVNGDEVNATLESGISHIKEIITAFKGAVMVRSNSGKGTAVTILLPVMTSEKKIETIDDIAPPQGTERLLFVDDESLLADVGKNYLAGLGYQVTSLTDSLKAWEILKDQTDRFDLVITDMTMPHLTGLKLAQEITALRPGIPVILCSGYHDRLSMSTDGFTGVSAMIAKPFKLPELAVLVRRLLDQRTAY